MKDSNGKRSRGGHGKKRRRHDRSAPVLIRGKPANRKALKAAYKKRGLHKIPDTFVLYRIIGNDLYPRHEIGQARNNLQFILDNEPKLAHCEKRWVVNRIFNPREEQAIIGLLRRHRQSFVRIPFDETKYQQVPWDTNCFPEPGFLAGERFESLPEGKRKTVITAAYRLKNNYVMNNNGARNTALRDGRSRAKWVLPLDGNCFVTKKAWDRLRADVAASPYLPYFVVPMTRMARNEDVLAKRYVPDPISEPQLMFRFDAREEFDERYCYGRRPKVELLLRLGVPGRWQRWKDESWDPKRRPASPESGRFGVAGWVARLSSGKSRLDRENKESVRRRVEFRRQAILGAIRHVDAAIARKKADPLGLTFIRSEVLAKEKKQYGSGQAPAPVRRLLADAEEALKRGPYSVVDKTSLPPSGKANDYWHPAPYWWPNPKTKNGLPYIRRDGKRVPGTQLYEKSSDRYDRSRLQRVFDDSMTLALAWYFTGKRKYAEHGARILERFFVHPSTRMNPHLKYAQVVRGRNNDEGFGFGIIEMKDMAFYLDAVRLLKRSGAVSGKSGKAFKKWLKEYSDWLAHSDQGKQERRARNNHGIYYDLQVAAIADYLDDRQRLFETLVRAQSRIGAHFNRDGSQPEELKRTTTAHYCCFNLQGWIHMAVLAGKWGTDLWTYKASSGASLRKGARWLLSHAGKKWPYPQIDPFNGRRFAPIWFSLPAEVAPDLAASAFPASKYAVDAAFSSGDGIRPYWNLGLRRP